MARKTKSLYPPHLNKPLKVPSLGQMLAQAGIPKHMRRTQVQNDHRLQ